MDRGVVLMRLQGPWAFYVDFVLFPSLAIVLLAGWCRSPSFIVLMLSGILLFTFAEYWIHRVGLHAIHYHGQHEHHHKHPADYSVFPLWYSTGTFAVFWAAMPLPLFTGMVIGYCWFLYWHHILHHFDLSNWPRSVRRYALWHLAHHHDETCNFGIAVPVWDFLFGTYRKI